MLILCMRSIASSEDVLFDSNLVSLKTAVERMMLTESGLRWWLCGWRLQADLWWISIYVVESDGRWLKLKVAMSSCRTMVGDMHSCTSQHMAVRMGMTNNRLVKRYMWWPMDSIRRPMDSKWLVMVQPSPWPTSKRTIPRTGDFFFTILVQNSTNTFNFNRIKYNKRNKIVFRKLAANGIKWFCEKLVLWWRRNSINLV